MTRYYRNEAGVDHALSEPIVQMLMAADGLELSEVRSQLLSVADRLCRRRTVVQPPTIPQKCPAGNFDCEGMGVVAQFDVKPQTSPSHVPTVPA